MGAGARVQLFVDNAVTIVVAVVAGLGRIGVDTSQPIVAVIAAVKTDTTPPP
jgi:hypothetical protein